MHAGRGYAYHPTFWATEAWFWPGFVPWKLRFNAHNNSQPPWSIYPAGYGEISQPGVVSADGHVIRYEFTAHILLYGLIVTLEKRTALGVDFARWRCELVSGAITWGIAVNPQPYPQRLVFNRFWPFIFGTPAYPTPAAPNYQFDCPTWPESGSPWAHY
jgi:hypothetical protein